MSEKPIGVPEHDKCDAVKALDIQFKELKKQHEELVKTVGSQGEELKGILEFQGGTKVYVVEIKEQLDRMEERLFKFMGDLVSNLTKKEETVATVEAKAESEKLKAGTVRWEKALAFGKDVIKMALAALAGYWASRGGS